MAGFYQRKNNAKSTVDDNPFAQSATTLNVASGEGANFPSSGDFLVTIWDKSTYRDPSDDSNMEIVRCTSRSTDALTVVRAQESTSDVEHAQGQAVEMLITAGSIDQLQPIINETPTGDINGSNVTFTLANTPLSTGDVMIFLDGMLLVYTDDYAISTNTVTMTWAPETGQKLRATYWY